MKFKDSSTTGQKQPLMKSERFQHNRPQKQTLMKSDEVQRFQHNRPQRHGATEFHM